MGPAGEKEVEVVKEEDRCQNAHENSFQALIKEEDRSEQRAASIIIFWSEARISYELP